jgi:hypothetical protein
MGPNFDKILLVAGDDLLVEGPFETHGKVVDDVLVRIVISHNGTESYATATVLKSAVTTSGTAPDVISRARFSTTVSVPGIAVGATVRAIGLSVALKRADPPPPPDHRDPSAFETFTWCVTRKVTGEQAPAS